MFRLMQQLHQISSNVQAQATESAGRSRQVETLAREGIENVHQNIGSMEETTRQVDRASLEIQELEETCLQWLFLLRWESCWDT